MDKEYYSNDYLDRQLQPVKRARHTIISRDKYGLLELQHKDWPYIAMSEKENFQLENEDKVDLENELLLDVINNLNICSHFCSDQSL